MAEGLLSFMVSLRSAIIRIVSSDAKATASVVSDLLLPHKLQLVQRGVPIGNLIRLAREAESRNASVL